MKAEGREVRLPLVSLPWMIDAWFEIGLFETTGMDRAPISWREINEWGRARGAPLHPWQARLIRKMSADYLAFGRKAEDRYCPAPWTDDVVDEADIAAELRGLEALGEPGD